MTDTPEHHHENDSRIHLAFDRNFVTIPVSAIVPLKTLPEGARESRSYAQVLSSIKAIGLVEAPVVMTDTENAGTWFLLDGHLRLEALKELGITEVECLLTTDDDTYTYNKRVNRIPPIQEHRMIVRAMERGVSAIDIAQALDLEVQSVLRRFRLLEGISVEAAEMLKDTPCSMKVFDILRQMSAVRQIEAADLMIGQNNFSIMFARAIRAATPESQLVSARKGRGTGTQTPSGQQIARMERELAALQTQVKSVDETYGIDNLHLTVARGYIAKLLANSRIVRWLTIHQQDYLGEFQKIAEIDTLGPIADEPNT
ncbi:plasmid partitioning protein RepB C-terminal domain-containing protein [Acidomonas methanolica]|uniref:Replication protein RepB n=1 Tax=Acidomonas methanolica NBRC 104435 TaxID=1231351 RepID=A0A023D6L1_ACIMT|nr:plasmid partitioning protein RepB C-terminal domain-containing protein [Acidomonas methanolica]MBU2655520.1 ParB N-terminal domain-containing protein [Acidomonas methanolica]TCS21705.1 ParB-like nuclease family protein [Acidomonas methanolica]GAJ29797.1 replication protein RepB [Acidomonas methanolica NBRC 104435]GBQ46876.1 RepB plasmid partition protein [Acidomonas methanolica]GEL00354.1 chromosome partitioning protein ParB [Acidomonas methanolica NBRC 104435]